MTNGPRREGLSALPGRSVRRAYESAQKAQIRTNYPASGTSNEATPVMWPDYLGAMTSIYGLASLKSAPPAP